MYKKKKISKTIKNVFTNIESIVDNHKIMLEFFEEKIIKNWNFNNSLGEIFQKHLIPILDLYINYALTYHDSQMKIKSRNFASMLTVIYIYKKLINNFSKRNYIQNNKI